MMHGIKHAANAVMLTMFHERCVAMRIMAFFYVMAMALKWYSAGYGSLRLRSVI